MANCKTEDERRKTEELIRPILRGRDIKRYGYEWANLYLIATFPARHYNINDYPAIKDYLLSFAEDNLRDAGYDWVADHYLADFCKQKLSQTGKFVEIKGERIILGNTPEKARKKTSNKWFETQDSISYWEEFFKPKVMYSNMTKYIPFYYDTRGFYQNDKSFMITGRHIAFLTAFLNSSIFKFCFLNNFPELQGGTRELRKVFFDKIPVIQIDDQLNERFASRILEMQNKPTVEKAKRIDKLLFDVYGLTDAERAIIGFIEIQ